MAREQREPVSETPVHPIVSEDREYARVVPLSGRSRIGHSLTYRVPDFLRHKVSIGTVVAVEVRRTPRIGVITALHDRDESVDSSPFAIKDIRTAYLDEVLLSPSDVSIAKWIGGYYGCSLRDALSPFAPEIRALQATVMLVAPEPGRFHEALSSLGLLFSRPGTVPIEEREDGSARISRVELVEVLRGGAMSEEASESIVKSWIDKEILTVEIGIRTRIRHLGVESWLTLTDEAHDSDWDKLRSDRQQKVLALLDNFGGTLTREEILREITGSQSAVRALVKKGFLSEIVDGSLVPPEDPGKSSLALSDAQRNAVDAITKSIDKGESRTFLLFGVTSSGKTEVYLEVCRKAISLGKRATILVPEIALTYQIVQRFMHTFPRRIALLHSELTERERLHEWRSVRRGERDIVIGARSALFAPMPDRGVIVIDEESETAYKQHQRPKYHTREVARRMARAERSVLVMGSATPSIETYHSALKRIYTLLNLPARVVGGKLPIVQCVKPDDFPITKSGEKEKIDVDGRKISINLMSSIMREELSKTLFMKRQALLLLNLRGFAQSLICPKCGWVPKCPECEVSLTYHRRNRMQLCHHCDHREPVVHDCRRCGYDKMNFLGWGTERLEAEVKALHPAARILRMDRDSVSSRGRRRKIVEAMHSGDVDILLGTQMVAKGLDFPRVRLVGVISADQSLHVPDFRAAERTFQLLTQVIGRAGRSDELESEGGGVAIIQSYDPENRVIKTACSQDFEAFYKSEIILRERFGYPPAFHLARLIFSGAKKEVVENTAMQFGSTLEKEKTGGDISVLGPARAPFEKLEGKWRYHCILKAPRVSMIIARIRAANRITKIPRDVKMDIDVDPMSML